MIHKHKKWKRFNKTKSGKIQAKQHNNKNRAKDEHAMGLKEMQHEMRQRYVRDSSFHSHATTLQYFSVPRDRDKE